ncbi:GNAT family N-acetyltransferase [Rhizobium paknamense]|uniref:GNAT superfamily N-acetyltransferase n=1 Tax=Rhizobium paknamense TaxID=1206817 RepID=A0ABU0IAD6_9HYPH|nr:GNAT family N-acetyltransferase [Rhizobium paknamense]MDQ0455194.1 GNAT superfamily N-acetyltransferase [Rhizobium paknamense]
MRWLRSDRHGDLPLILEALRRDRLRNVSVLKYLLAFPQNSLALQVQTAGRVATALLLEQRVVDYDRQAYPTAETIIFLQSGDAELTRHLMTAFPQDRIIVFKLMSTVDEAVLAAGFPLERQRGYMTYTTSKAPDLPSSARLETAADGLPFDLFAAQGHAAGWVRCMVETGRAFASVYRAADAPLATCLAFELDEGLWEIGALYTVPDARGRGLGRQVVTTALRTILEAGHIPRYHVEDSNMASMTLAQGLGLSRAQVLTHFLSVPGRAHPVTTASPASL